MALSLAALNNPTTRRLAKGVATATIRAMGRSRRRRANNGKWFFGKRVGIPPNRNGGIKPSYQTTAVPAARPSIVQTAVSATTRTESGDEMLCKWANASSTSTFVESFVINPADAYTFPRMSQIAFNYQKYTLNRLRLIYTPSCASTVPGIIYFGFMNDPTADIPMTAEEINMLAGTVKTGCYQRFEVEVPKTLWSHSLAQFYIKDGLGVAPQLQDITASVGRIVILSDGLPGTSGIVGTVNLQYSFTLTDPKLGPGSAVSGLTRFTAPETGVLDLDGDWVGMPMFIKRGDVYIKRETSPYVVVYRGEGATTGPSTLCEHYDGANWVGVDPIDEFSIQSDPVMIRTWRLNPGRGIYRFTLEDAAVSASIAAFSAPRIAFT